MASPSPQQGTSGSPPAGSSAHQEAAAAAAAKLDEAVSVLAAAFGHPHFGDRLDAITAHAATLKGWIGHLPEEEESRAEYASRLLALHKARQLPVHLPDHADRLLNQELERSA